jgi:putative thiamine transport system substrate-binding protein
MLLKAYKLIIASLCFIFTILSAQAQFSEKQWLEILAEAKGQSVYFNAWGGSKSYNAYISWVSDEVRRLYGIKLHHVKLKDTADAVQKVLAEKQARNDNNGSIDLIWINGENFAKMKEENLLYGPFGYDLPNYVAYINEEETPGVIKDFNTYVDGYESPWGKAQFVVIHDDNSSYIKPLNMLELLQHARNHPFRVTYPTPLDFTGMTFLKQLVYELVDDPEILADAPNAQSKETLQDVWQYLDELHQVAWRGGEDFPKNESEMINLLNNGEIDFAFSFNISSAHNAIQKRQLMPSARAYVLRSGTIANVNFVAIPYNSKAKEAAMVVANFLLEPRAQARKQDPGIWGDPTVLSFDLLPDVERKWFVDLPKTPAIPSEMELSNSIPEPHSAWVEYLRNEWVKRYRR